MHNIKPKFGLFRTGQQEIKKVKLFFYLKIAFTFCKYRRRSNYYPDEAVYEGFAVQH